MQIQTVGCHPKFQWLVVFPERRGLDRVNDFKLSRFVLRAVSCKTGAVYKGKIDEPVLTRGSR